MDCVTKFFELGYNVYFLFDKRSLFKDEKDIFKYYISYLQET